jgi:hypothetical protein
MNQFVFSFTTDNTDEHGYITDEEEHQLAAMHPRILHSISFRSGW